MSGKLPANCRCRSTYRRRAPFSNPHGLSNSSRAPISPCNSINDRNSCQPEKRRNPSSSSVARSLHLTRSIKAQQMLAVTAGMIAGHQPHAIHIRAKPATPRRESNVPSPPPSRGSQRSQHHPSSLSPESTQPKPPAPPRHGEHSAIAGHPHCPLQQILCTQPRPVALPRPTA